MHYVESTGTHQMDSHLLALAYERETKQSTARTAFLSLSACVHGNNNTTKGVGKGKKRRCGRVEQTHQRSPSQKGRHLLPMPSLPPPPPPPPHKHTASTGTVSNKGSLELSGVTQNGFPGEPAVSVATPVYVCVCVCCTPQREEKSFTCSKIREEEKDAKERAAGRSFPPAHSPAPSPPPKVANTCRGGGNRSRRSEFHGREAPFCTVSCKDGFGRASLQRSDGLV